MKLTILSRQGPDRHTYTALVRSDEPLSLGEHEVVLTSGAFEKVHRAICAEKCAFYGEPPCYSVGDEPLNE